MKLIPEEERESISSLSHVAWNLPNALSSRAGDYIMDYISLDLPIPITSLIYAVYAVTFYFYSRKIRFQSLKPEAFRLTSDQILISYILVLPFLALKPAILSPEIVSSCAGT